ncbi:MAG: Flp pilus assembly complex ATPase component TadA, partial [Clostridia bacterium]|nr:Flp pilus assembly complex ATPase component TadA [Clostridia bacterium]
MLNYMNTNFEYNMVTIEDPIEFLHSHKKSIVRQRELGSDTLSFNNALRTVLRHDPDVIMIGEMRDPESISIALTAAETGHLVLSTLHTQTAPLTIARIIDSFPSSQQNQVRSQLSNTLKAVISQQLLPRLGGGRVAAIEYMIDTPAIKSMIREGKDHQLYSTMQTAQKEGMQTMDQSLLKLLREQRISRESVLENCIERADIIRQMQVY